MKYYVLLTDDDNATALVECEDQAQAEATAAAAVFSDGDVSAWLVPGRAFTDAELVADLLRESNNCSALHEAYDNGNLRTHRVTLESAVQSKPDVKVERDSDGEITRLVCPNCGKPNIYEHDKAERWNPIEIVTEGVLSVSQQQSDFETVGLVCRDCSTELDAPQDVYDAMEFS